MRMTILEGVEDGVQIDLGSDVGIVCAVMRRGKAKSALVFEACMTGAEVLQMLQDEKYRYIDDVRGDIVAENHYILTAFDD